MGLSENCKEVASASLGPSDLKLIKLETNNIFTVSVSLRHEHEVYGTYQPLLGKRSTKISIRNHVICNRIEDLSTEQYFAVPAINAISMESIEPKNKSDEFYHSAPDSLCLLADIPSFRFPEQSVRYNTKMKLSFYYYFVKGSEGCIGTRIAQYAETKNYWKVLGDQAFDIELKNSGKMD